MTSQQRVMSERSVVMVEEDESSKKELVMAQTTRGEELGPLDHKWKPRNTFLFNQNSTLIA